MNSAFLPKHINNQLTDDKFTLIIFFYLLFQDWTEAYAKTHACRQAKD